MSAGRVILAVALFGALGSPRAVSSVVRARELLDEVRAELEAALVAPGSSAAERQDAAALLSHLDTAPAAEPPAKRFIANGDGTVTDTASGLMWADSDSGAAQTYDGAVHYCGRLGRGGHSDWRLPRLFEMETLGDKESAREHRIHGDIRISQCTPWVTSDNLRRASNVLANFCGRVGRKVVTPRNVRAPALCVRALEP